LAVAQSLALVAAAAVIFATIGPDRWSVGPLIVIALFTILSSLTYVNRVHISGSLLGLVMAAVVLGGGPAAVIGLLSVLLAWGRTREPPHQLRNNLVTYVWFPLAAALFFRAAVDATGVGRHELGYYLLVLATFLVAVVLNFAGVAGYDCYLDGSSLLHRARTVFPRVLPAELFSALLTVAAVAVAVPLGTIGIASFLLVLVVFQYLIGELLRSKRRGAELHRKATTDELSGLANREHLHQLVEQAIDTARKTDRAFSVMLVDLDRFKEVNDTFGHDYGDALLRELGPRLATCVGGEGVVARMGGDEFAVLPGLWSDDPEQLEEIALRLLACIQRPFVADELSVEVGASIGIARFPTDGEDLMTLLRRADVAMYAAKEAQSGHKLYAAEHDRHSVHQLGLMSEIRRALEDDEIVVFYQPIVQLPELEVCGAEALARWQHPERGLLAPGAFIPLVEGTALIGPFTQRMLDRSIAQCAAWRRDGLELTVSVNLSVRNLMDAQLAGEIEAMLFKHGLAPEALKLEITESTIMSDVDRVLVTVARLSELGMRISVDDFGTGYSSLANLRRLQIDELKIDRSFVTPMLEHESDMIIVRSTINLAHDLGLRVVAEGVEDAAMLEQLGVLGCDLAQGFHISRPIPADEFTAFALERQAEPVSAASR
jgi:diguanylate cyclase (GGDEF)-like protein